jgi:hypothetical protein
MLTPAMLLTAAVIAAAQPKPLQLPEAKPWTPPKTCVYPKGHIVQYYSVTSKDKVFCFLGCKLVKKSRERTETTPHGRTIFKGVATSTGETCK